MEVIQQNILNFKKLLGKGILFISCLEIIFILIKANKRAKGINIFEHTYFYLAYADDATFFLRYKRSVKELINTFATF